MATFPDREVKCTAKQHICVGCGCKIPEGSHAVYISGIYEGYFSSGHICDVCNAFRNSYGDKLYNDGDGWEFYTLHEYYQYKDFKKGYEAGLLYSSKSTSNESANSIKAGLET